MVIIIASHHVNHGHKRIPIVWEVVVRETRCPIYSGMQAIISEIDG